MAKLAGRVGFGLVNRVCRLKWVIFKRVNWVAGRIGLPIFFKQVFFFFFQLQKQINDNLLRENE